MCFSHSFIHSFIHSFCCLTNPYPLLKRVLHTVRPSVSSFNLQYPLFSLRSSNSCLRLLPRLPVTSILPCTFPSITCFRNRFLHSPHQSSLPSFVSLHVGYSFPPSLYVTLLHFSHDRSNWSSPSFSSTTFQNFQVFLIYFPTRLTFSTKQSHVPDAALYQLIF